MKLVLLHGYTQNGRALRADLAPLLDRLEGFEVLSPDAPFACDPAALARLGGALAVDPARAPHLTWWRATDDGAAYHGWETARAELARLLEGGGPAGVLGFSQGAMLAACAAAWSARGELPPLDFAVMVAGRVPRATDLRPLFESPVPVRSLHVWGARDPMAGLSPELADRFVGAERLPWEGPHVVPTRGAAAEVLVGFLRARSAGSGVSSPDRHPRR